MRPFLFTCTTLVLLRCAAGTAQSGGDQRNVLTGDQLRTSREATVEAAVRKLRPEWFTLGRETTSVDRQGAIQVCRGDVIIYIDGKLSARGAFQVTLDRVDEVRLIRPGRARPDGNRSCRGTPAIDVITRDGSER